MCVAVAEAFARGRHLLVEAPTGTGKSIAYAVAAAMHAREVGDDTEREGRVVVTTATKALQEQLCEHDLPEVARALEADGIDFSFALLKGRANYLCAAKLDELAGTTEPGTLLAPTARERARSAALTRVREWAESTETGDRAELDDDVPDEVWDALSTSARDCPGARNCPAGDRCFAEAARERASSAQVVVVNTALYGAHLVAGGHVLPPHDAVVIDEAHLCEDVFADQFGVDVHGGRLRHLASEVEGDQAGLAAADRLRRASRRLDEICAEIARRPDPRVRAAEGELGELLGTVRRAVADASASLKARTVEPGTPAASRKLRAEKAAQTLDAEVGLALDPDVYDTHVAWCADESGSPRLVLMPVVVGEVLATRLAPHATVVATSATLAFGGSFDPIATRLGLAGADWDGLRVESPFDFREQALLYVPRHLPDPRGRGYTDAMVSELHALITAAGGRTLALFTSWSMMRAAAERCAQLGGYEVLRQGDKPRRVLVDALREGAGAGGVAVFATMGFWTGVDVAGLGVTLVAIDRIPFPRPNDPLFAARRDRASSAGRDAFAEVDLPRAAMLLAQGSGRLIRHREDRGVVAVLDRRLATAGYRRVLLDTMPPFRRTVDGDAVRAFLREVTGAVR